MKTVSKPAWKILAKGRWKTDLGGDLPEVVILHLTNSAFNKFKSSVKAAKAYLDNRGYFKRKLIKLIFADTVPCPGGAAWFVIVTHTTHSTAVVVAFQICED